MKQRQTVTLEPAFVLHRRPYRDASVIAELLTARHGRVALVVRGAGKGSRRCFEAFRPLLVSYVRRGDLGSLTAVEGDGRPAALGGEAIYCAYYANELLLRMTHRDESVPELFKSYQTLLEELGGVIADKRRALRLFEKRLLELVGYGRDLSCEWQSGQPLKPDAWYRVAPEQGPEPVATGVREPDVFAGSSLLSLAREELADPVTLGDARRLLRLSIDYYLDGRPLKTRAVMQAMRRHQVPAAAGD